MNTDLNQNDSPLLGLVAGLAAGVVGAWAMTEFQSLLERGHITSGVSGTPSTEKAADRLAQLATGRPLGRGIRPAAGEAVHYAFGGLVGGLYGLAAEVAPRVKAGQGAAFGVVAATVVDETLVPAMRLGDPVWKAPLVSHPYSYASHTVFGTATEAARKFFRRFFGEVKAGADVLRNGTQPEPLETEGPGRWRTLRLAFLLGATAGPRTSAPLTTVSWAARLGLIDLKDSKLSALASPKAVWMTTPMALGELVADKLPSTPSRIEPAGVVGRAATGALSGAALAGGRSAEAALAGAAGAVAATYLGYLVRTRVSRAIGRDWPIAGAEDVLAFGGAALVCLAALAPRRP
ncbi:DUF1440 domain-containing protein [Xylophilus sp. Kf1]|nr:DUF1440 domain-containing protein [Xylophilus sp. Kf1]